MVYVLLRRAPIAVVLSGLLLSLAGCGEDEDPLTVRGTVDVTLDGTRTGFEFATDTHIDDDRVAPADGRVAGHCTLSKSADGETSVISVGIVRPTVSAEDTGVRSFVIRVDDPREPARGAVTAELGADTFTATATDAGCTIEVTYLDVDGGAVGLRSECAITSGTKTASSVSELELSGCSQTY